MEQLVLLVIIGLISLVNWVLQKAAERREAARHKSPGEMADRRQIRPRAEPSRIPTPTPGQDPMRELMEALGLPAQESPPPLPRRPAMPFEEEVEEFASLETAAPVVSSPAIKRTQPVKPDEKTSRLAGAFAAAERVAEPPRVSGIRSLLSGRANQRHAVILAEILGKPRGLRPAGEMPAFFVP
ncbi:MAG: hypothetical protein FGM15_02810 [Chthoniobacterales bacterium]|nr:hypothetical protein [Chthoniobacterales bacterium]